MAINPAAPELEIVLPDGRPVFELEEDQGDLDTAMEFDVSPEGEIQQTTLGIAIFDDDKEEEDDFYINLAEEIAEEDPDILDAVASDLLKDFETGSKEKIPPPLLLIITIVRLILYCFAISRLF